MSDKMDYESEILQILTDQPQNSKKRRRINSLKDISFITSTGDVEEEKYSPASSRERLVHSNSPSSIQFEYIHRTNLKNHSNEHIRNLFSIYFENSFNIEVSHNISVNLKQIFLERSTELKNLLKHRYESYIVASKEDKDKFAPENVIEEHIYESTIKDLNKELIKSCSIVST